MLWGYCFFFLILSTLIIVFRRPILLRVILLKTHFFLFRCLLNMLKKSFFEVDASTTGEEIISFSYFLFKVSFTSLNIDWGLLLVLVPNFFSLLIWLVRRGEDLFLFFFFSFFFFSFFFFLFRQSYLKTLNVRISSNIFLKLFQKLKWIVDLIFLRRNLIYFNFFILFSCKFF